MLNTVSFFRTIKNGLVNFRRNTWLSLASTLIMVVTLIILSTLTLLFTVTRYSINTIKERVDISAYFKTGTPDNKIQLVKDDLETNPKVRSVTFVSADQALADFKEKHKDDPLITESLNELNENPLPGTLQVKAQTLDDYPAVAQQLSDDKYKDVIDKVNFEDNRIVIDRLNRILQFIVTFGLGLLAVFAIIAILVIYNTITLTIYNRKEEVEIMRLVGATNWYIRGPFIVEAVTSSVVASIITGLLLVPIYWNVLPKINTYLNPGTSINIFSQNYLHFQYIIIFQLIIALFLSILSSLLAIRKYLRV